MQVELLVKNLFYLKKTGNYLILEYLMLKVLVLIIFYTFAL